ncbi:glyceraldehyde-3-phosphate dehydrogenase [Aurantimicrobium sp. MWH-Uga1]|uniref:glyceraldehyde-3-phosphate dehydrogenase n=1 Tax=Aurantimicrobium sp. MWH-Uga1 TaxID=2079575 RepID=UPI000DEE07F5|nr:glyceraldehyde-3-phosphate dehydrogenase [Aurantimicrobium sp. MWH-Uga1]AXE54403.1 Glyceraldehyde-3-phosphate dehydrogenase [Aurantimicrobium sp. MWH-Uga1]
MAPHDATWTDRQAVAEELIPLIGGLYRDNGVVTSIHGRRLINSSPLQIVKAHRYARHVDGQELDINRTLELVRAIVALNPGPASINVAGILAEQAASGKSISEYAAEVLAPVAGQGRPATVEDSKDVVLYGFGRIGRLVARILLGNAENGRGPVLKAIVVRKGGDQDLVKRASLLRRDSVHGPFNGTITIDEEKNLIIANGKPIQVIYSNDPTAVDYTAFGIKDAILVDNTGRWRDEPGLSQHLEAKGISRVVLTAPGKSPLKNVVYGINHDTITDSDKIITAASCTTNAITPVLKVINDAYGVEYGHVETVHSYTNDQNLIDNFHKGDRRGRSAAMNMVITETGAAKAVAKALPELEGKLSGNAIRVPTPDVSMAILNLTLHTAVDRDTLNKMLREASLKSGLRNQIDYIESPEVVSTDFVGSNRAGIVDGLATIANGKNIILYVWYDNEYGYSHQVVRVIQELAGLHPPKFPAL